MAKGTINEDFNAKLTQEELREHCSKAGKASVEAKKKRKTLKEELLALLEEGDTQKNMTISILAEALNGNIKAFEVIRDTVGEKPKEKIEAEVDTNININIELDDEE